MSFSKIFLSGSIHYNHPSNEIVLCLIAVDWCCMQVGRNLLWPRLCNPAHVQLGHSSAPARPQLGHPSHQIFLCAPAWAGAGAGPWSGAGHGLAYKLGDIYPRCKVPLTFAQHSAFLSQTTNLFCNRYSDLWIYLEQYLQ